MDSSLTKSKKCTVRYHLMIYLLVIIFLGLCIEILFPSLRTKIILRQAIPIVPKINSTEQFTERVGQFEPYKFFCTYEKMVDKIRSFNIYLINETEKVLKPRLKRLDICDHTSKEKIPVARGFLNDLSQTYFTKLSYLKTDKSSNHKQQPYKTVDQHTLEQAQVKYLGYNYMNGGGSGVLTYILSWTNASQSDLYLDADYMRGTLHINTYYGCVESPRVDELGGWGKIAGSCYPSTCMYKCSTDLASLKDEITLPIQNVLTDFTYTTYGKPCPYRILDDATAIKMQAKFVRKHTLLNIMTAIDILPQGGIISEDGSVVSNSGYAFQHLHCLGNPSKTINPPNCKSYKKLPYYKEVFVISEPPPSFNFFHFFVEKVTRISAFVSLLKARPQIVIHTMVGTKTILPFFLAAHGLTNNVISGKVRANVIYFPQGGGCHNPHITAVQMANYHYHKYITQRLLNESESEHLKPIILFIKRTKRRLVNETEILTELQKLNTDKEYDILIFDDTELPSKEDTMRIFYRAKLIVAPHGAGLSNILFSKPGTTIIEVHCLGALRLSFFNLSIKLGMRYYGVPTLRLKSLSNRCMKEGLTVNMNDFKKVLLAVFSYL